MPACLCPPHIHTGAEPQGATPSECCNLCKSTDLCNAWVFCNRKVRGMSSTDSLHKAFHLTATLLLRYASHRPYLYLTPQHAASVV
jgi:hypothetical protein